MPAHRLDWIKFWPEAVDHEKFASLSDGEAWTWVVLWAKASQQQKRWRFGSVEHAAKVTGRPLKHIRRLIYQRLLDEREDGLFIHNARQWQDPSNLPPTQRQGPAIPAPSVTEDVANGDSRVIEDTLNGDRTVAEGWSNSDRETDTEGDIEKTSNPPVVPPAAAGGTAQAEAVPKRKGRRGRTKGEHTVITEDDVGALLEKYTPLFGNQRAVRLAIDKALNSTARLTWLDERHGVDTWLRGDLERLRERGKAPPPELVEEPPSADEIVEEPEEPFICPGCDVTGGSASSQVGLCFRCHHRVALWRRQLHDRGEVHGISNEQDWITKARELHEAAAA